jgi:hypothetical protein
MVVHERLSYPEPMPPFSLILLFLALSGGFPASWAAPARSACPSDEFTDRLEGLGSNSSLERERAERWLAAHIGPADYEGLRETARAGDIEVRRRLARVLGDRGGHLGLAVRFLGESDPPLRRVGEQAVRTLLSRWNSDLAAPGIVEEELERALGLLGERDRTELLQIDLAAPLDETVEMLAHLPGVPVALLVDPGLPTRSTLPPGEESSITEGTWWELVLRLAHAHGVGVEGFALPPERGELLRDGGLIRFTARAEIGKTPAEEFLLRWCSSLAGPRATGDSPRRRGAILSLAATGWPALIALLEERWESDRDRAALDGLLLSASRGRLAPCLVRGEELAELVTITEMDLDEGSPESLARAHRFLRALDSAGCISPAGEDLSEVVLQGWSEASPRGRWLRLALLETIGCHCAPGAAPRRAVRELLIGPPRSVPPLLLFQALRAWVVLVRGEIDPPFSTGAGFSSDADRLGDPEGLLRAPIDREESRDLVALLRRGQIAPPTAWRSPESLPESLDRDARLLLFAWWFGVDPAAAADHLRALLCPGAELEVELEVGDRASEILHRALLRGERDRVDKVWRLARRGCSSDRERLAIDRTAFLAGALAVERVALLVDIALLPPPPPERIGDLTLLGVVGGLPAGGVRAERARGVLLEYLGGLLKADIDRVDTSPARDVLAALERSLEGLWAGETRSGGPAERLLLDLEVLLREQRKSDLSTELRRREWPRPPRVDPRPLRADDRRLDPERLGIR